MKLKSKLLIIGAIVYTVCFDAFALTVQPHIEFDANGDAKFGSDVPPRPSRAYTDGVAPLDSVTVPIDSVAAPTDTVPICDFSKEQHELDMMRIRLANNLLYRQYDKRLNDHAVSEFAEIKDTELRKSRRELGDKLREYPNAFAEVHDFLCDIEEEPDRADRAGAKVWGQRNLGKLRALSAYKTSVGKRYSMVYLRDVIKRAEARLSECARSGTIVILVDIYKAMESGRNTKRIYDSGINTSSHLLGQKFTIGAIDNDKLPIAPKGKEDETKLKQKVVDADFQVKQTVTKDQPADACVEERREILLKTDELRVEYAELMLTMPWAERAGAAFDRLSEVKDEELSDKVAELKKTLEYYPIANAELAAFIDSLKKDAANNNEYTRAWYTKSLAALRDLPAYKHIVSDEADMQIEFLENIMIGIENRLVRAGESEAEPSRVGFDDFINEMRPL